MSEAIRQAVAQAAATGPVEAAAVALGFAYVFLAIRQRRACWVAGGLSTALYIMVFAEARLYLQAVLQVAYVALAVHGWRQWSRDEREGAGLRVRRPGWRLHAAIVAATVVVTTLSAPLLAAWSDAAAPWADALGTWASVAATWLMIRKVPASWLWWVVVDAGLAALFVSQGLFFTAVLYGAFAALAVAGWLAWRRAPRIA